MSIWNLHGVQRIFGTCSLCCRWSLCSCGDLFFPFLCVTEFQIFYFLYLKNVSPPSFIIFITKALNSAKMLRDGREAKTNICLVFTVVWQYCCCKPNNVQGVQGVFLWLQRMTIVIRERHFGHLVYVCVFVWVSLNSEVKFARLNSLKKKKSILTFQRCCSPWWSHYVLHSDWRLRRNVIFLDIISMFCYVHFNYWIPEKWSFPVVANEIKRE